MKDGATVDKSEKLDGHISNKEYLTCNKIWSKFNMKNMRDYNDHYLEKDALLLADVFEKFIDTCLMLKMTGVRLEKISDINMYLLV